MEEAVLKKVPPHHKEAERGVVGAMMIDMDAAVKAMGALSADDFYLKECAYVFDAVKNVVDEGGTVDPTTVSNKLMEMNAPEEIASGDFLRNLIMYASTSTGIDDHIEIVQTKSLLRGMIKLSRDIENRCYQDTGDAADILEEAERKVFEITNSRTTRDYVSIRQIVKTAVDKIGIAAKMDGAVTGVATGFIQLDHMTAGLQPSDLILIAARPSMGKTAFALNIADHVCFRDKKGVAIFSLEMSKEQLVNRLLALESHVDSDLIRKGNVSAKDWEGIIEGASIIGESKLIIDDTPGISIGELRTKCRKYKAENKDLSLIIIDYLQLMTGSRRGGSRELEISDISRSLKSIARELNVPVVALSQLSRAVEKREEHRPMLSDLRESGAIEQDADVVMFLYRDEVYNKETANPGIAEVIIAKQRNGPIGTCELVWISNLTKFANKALV
ncbi:MAG: replicative DNA helicase [Lachnospiraceae bacterium]|nr:replicative DNA helicase [Lachnospiraceae bacterium]